MGTNEFSKELWKTVKIITDAHAAQYVSPADIDREQLLAEQRAESRFEDQRLHEIARQVARPL